MKKIHKKYYLFNSIHTLLWELKIKGDNVTTVLIGLCIIFTLLFCLLNGKNDGTIIIATLVASRSMAYKHALLVALIIEIIGPFCVGTAVASTVGKGILYFDVIEQGSRLLFLMMIFSALLSALICIILAMFFSIPVSTSHCLIGGMIGSAVIAYSIDIVQWKIFFNKVIVVMFLGPIVCFISSYICMKLSLLVLQNVSLHHNLFLKRSQLVTMGFLVINHSSSNAQKGAGVLGMILAAGGCLNEFTVSIWMLLACSMSLALGVVLGGNNMIRTVGEGIYKVKPLHSFNTQLVSSMILFFFNIIGAPISSAQVVVSSIMGVGTAERMKGVRWKRVERILISWILTFPISIFCGTVIFWIINRILQTF